MICDLLEENKRLKEQLNSCITKEEFAIIYQALDNIANNYNNEIYSNLKDKIKRVYNLSDTDIEVAVDTIERYEED